LLFPLPSIDAAWSWARFIWTRCAISTVPQDFFATNNFARLVGMTHQRRRNFRINYEARRIAANIAKLPELLGKT
jgi:hypothetical protein